MEKRLTIIRAALNKVTGDRSPSHQGKKRFWNDPVEKWGKIYGQTVVVPGHPDQSAFVKALRGLPPFDGTSFSRMPVNGPYLDESLLCLIEGWIKDGCPPSDPDDRAD